jgi:hypothetical protein
MWWWQSTILFAFVFAVYAPLGMAPVWIPRHLLERLRVLDMSLVWLRNDAFSAYGSPECPQAFLGMNYESEESEADLVYQLFCHSLAYAQMFRDAQKCGRNAIGIG